jgi:uncharacterized protein (DUF488 family)
LGHYSEYLANSPDVVNSVATLSRDKRPALFCYEADADECHRGVLIAALMRLNPDLTVVYL